MNNGKARRRRDQAGIFPSVKNRRRTFFLAASTGAKQELRSAMDWQRSGKCLPDPAFVHENTDGS